MRFVVVEKVEDKRAKKVGVADINLRSLVHFFFFF